MQKCTKAKLELVNQQLKEMISLYRGAVSHAGISENEFWIWYALINMEGEYTQQDICGIWSLSKQTVNTIISHLVQKGHVVLETIPNTRNSKRITLTGIGRAYGEKLVMPIFAAEQRAYERLPEEEQLACTKVLGNYAALLKEELYGTER